MGGLDRVSTIVNTEAPVLSLALVATLVESVWIGENPDNNNGEVPANRANTCSASKVESQTAISSIEPTKSPHAELFWPRQANRERGCTAARYEPAVLAVGTDDDSVDMDFQLGQRRDRSSQFGHVKVNLDHISLGADFQIVVGDVGRLSNQYVVHPMICFTGYAGVIDGVAEPK